MTPTGTSRELELIDVRSEQRKKNERGDKQEGKNVRRKSVFRWDPWGKNPFEKEEKKKKKKKRERFRQGGA